MISRAYLSKQVLIDTQSFNLSKKSIIIEGNDTALIYGGKNIAPNSSLIIPGELLTSNQTYQFMVHMQNHRNSSVVAKGYLLVRIEDTRPQLIVLG